MWIVSKIVHYRVVTDFLTYFSTYISHLIGCFLLCSKDIFLIFAVELLNFSSYNQHFESSNFVFHNSKILEGRKVVLMGGRSHWMQPDKHPLASAVGPKQSCLHTPAHTHTQESTHSLSSIRQVLARRPEMSAHIAGTKERRKYQTGKQEER